MSQLETQIGVLLQEHGIVDVLAAISECAKKQENIIKDRHDSTLGNAFDYMLPELVRAVEYAPRKQASMPKRTLLSKSVQEAMVIRKSDNPFQSEAVREAAAKIKQWRAEEA